MAAQLRNSDSLQRLWDLDYFCPSQVSPHFLKSLISLNLQHCSVKWMFAPSHTAATVQRGDFGKMTLQQGSLNISGGLSLSITCVSDYPQGHRIKGENLRKPWPFPLNSNTSRHYERFACVNPATRLFLLRDEVIDCSTS